jgi:hypothetical protein
MIKKLRSQPHAPKVGASSPKWEQKEKKENKLRMENKPQTERAGKKNMTRT